MRQLVSSKCLGESRYLILVLRKEGRASKRDFSIRNIQIMVNTMKKLCVDQENMQGRGDLQNRFYKASMFESKWMMR